MTWQNLLVECLLITASANLSHGGKMMDNGMKSKAAHQSNSLLLLSNHLFTTPLYSQAQTSSTELVHAASQLANKATHSVPKEKETATEPMPSSANKIAGHIQAKATVAPKMTSAKSTGQHTVYPMAKATVVTKRTVKQTEPLVDQSKIRRDSRKTLATERTTLISERPNSQKATTLTLPVIMANTNKIASKTSDNRITQPTTKRTSGMAQNNRTSAALTAPMPTTPLGPTLAPKPSPAATGAYSVSNGTADCIKALMGLTMIAKNRKTNSMEYFNIDPNTTQTTGICGASLSVLKISFQGGFISFTFNKNGEVYYVSVIEATLTVPSEGSPYTGIKSDELFSVQVGNCFKCTGLQTVDMSDNLQLQIANSQLQAFDIVDDQFGTVEECALDRNKKLIPTTVALSLVGLIVIVIVTCAIYRRKPTSGYDPI
ncbi:lysosome-associated membrane glycoprotein 3 [Sceloporus undulatus]|uniref:lysosome-associated membrane glycoprotein 3 n=1 Tax=Sceloporus undulatus TaxID=8520 RepID=UPI001C4C685E|nr:lysosome-associated membrane glycoprotein 3 [Sceloporus undulatus]